MSRVKKPSQLLSCKLSYQKTRRDNKLPTYVIKKIAKGRTNIELREKFILADGVSQSMAAFKPRRSVDRDSTTESPLSGIPTQGPIVKVNFPIIFLY